MSKGTKTTHTGVHKYSIPGKKAADALTEDEKDLYELAQLSGVELSPAVFRILVDLLKHNVSPVAIAQVLKSMIRTKTPNTMTLMPDTSRSGSSSSSRGQYDSTSGMTTSAMSSRKGTSGSSSLSGLGSSISSSASSARTHSDLSKKGTSSTRVPGGGLSSRSGSGRQRGTNNDMTGQRQPKS